MATAIIHMWCDSFRSSAGVSLDGSGETPCLYVHGAAAPTDTHEVDVSYACGRAWCSSFEELCFVDEGGFRKEEVLKGPLGNAKGLCTDVLVYVAIACYIGLGPPRCFPGSFCVICSTRTRALCLLAFAYRVLGQFVLWELALESYCFLE